MNKQIRFYRVTNLVTLFSNLCCGAHSALMMMKLVLKGSALWAISIPERKISQKFKIWTERGHSKKLGNSNNTPTEAILENNKTENQCFPSFREKNIKYLLSELDSTSQNSC